MAERYEYNTVQGRAMRRVIGSSAGWQPMDAATPAATTKSTAAVKSDLGYKSGGSDPDLSDEAIAKMSPLMQASARARRAKKKSDTDTQRDALEERRKAAY